MNVDSNFADSNPQFTPAQQSTLGQLVQIKQANSGDSAGSKTVVTKSEDSSITSFFQSDSSTTKNTISNSFSNVNSLQDFFNQVQVPESSNNGGINIISNNLNDILSGFSNSNSSQSFSQTINVSVTPQTLVSKSINLNFNDSQKSTVSTDEANALFLRQKLASEYVAGNYSIVLQLAANKNMLNSLIANLTKQYQSD